MTYPPRPGDLPREQLMKMADDAIMKYGGREKAYVNFKFTCEQCGERCTLAEENQLYERGECFKCGHEMPIAFGGFTLALRLS